MKTTEHESNFSIYWNNMIDVFHWNNAQLNKLFEVNNWSTEEWQADKKS